MNLSQVLTNGLKAAKRNAILISNSTIDAKTPLSLVSKGPRKDVTKDASAKLIQDPSINKEKKF